MVGAFLGVLLAAAPAGPRVIQLAVTDDGFQPAQVLVKKGEPLRLVFTRKTDHTCAKEVRVAGVIRKLPLNAPVEVELTPDRSGQIRYACAMDMVAGVLLVE